MNEIESLTVFTGKDAFPISLGSYDVVKDESLEYENSLETIINFYKDGKIVRTMINPRCDIHYKSKEVIDE